MPDIPEKRLEELRKDFENQPLAKAFGFKLKKIDTGHAAVIATVRDEFLVTAGIVQGGVIATVADFAGVYAAMAAILEGHTPLSNGYLNLFGSFKKDELIIAVGTVVNESKRSLVVEVEVFSDSVSDDRKKALFMFHFAKPRNK